MKVHDGEAGHVSDEELRHGPRRPWLGPHRPLLHCLAKPIIDILHVEAAGGVALVVAAAAALVWANSPWQAAYEDLWSTEAALTVGGFNFELREDLRHWVNDGLMVLFFFVVGLEIKAELVTGELADARRAALPIAAAAGGMALPALVYGGINASGGALEGWGVPVATKIGDGATGALVGRDGSIDWLCVPRFDGESLVCGLLDSRRGGSFRVAPTELHAARQHYEHDTAILVTELHAAGGGGLLYRYLPAESPDGIPGDRQLARRHT